MFALRFVNQLVKVALLVAVFVFSIVILDLAFNSHGIEVNILVTISVMAVIGSLFLVRVIVRDDLPYWFIRDLFGVVAGTGLLFIQSNGEVYGSIKEFCETVLFACFFLHYFSTEIWPATKKRVKKIPFISVKKERVEC